MNFCLTEEQQLLRRTVREFSETEIRPHIREWDEAQQFPRELLAKLADLGVMGIQFAPEYGGSGMSAIDYCICIEELARVDPSVSLSVAAHNGLGAAHIDFFGSEAQKQQYLTPLARGEKLAAWGLTEPGSGSDAAAMRTTATRDGDQLGAERHRRRSSRTAASGDTMVVMAVSDKSKGNKGISAFIVERGTPGFSAGKKEDKLGMRASETTEVIFQNCRVPADQLIGEEGQGFIQTLQVLDAGRIGIAALAVGLAQGAYEAARDYAFQRKQFGRAIGTFQSIRWKLVDNADPRRGVAPADLSRRLAEGSGPPHDAGVVDGQAVRERGRGPRLRGLRADPRRLRLREGLSRREILPRREADDDRGGHERGAAPRDRPPAAGPLT